MLSQKLIQNSYFILNMISFFKKMIFENSLHINITKTLKMIFKNLKQTLYLKIKWNVEFGYLVEKVAYD